MKNCAFDLRLYFLHLDYINYKYNIILWRIIEKKHDTLGQTNLLWL